MKAKRKVEEISKEDVQAFLKKNAFVLFTVGAVIVGERHSWGYRDNVSVIVLTRPTPIVYIDRNYSGIWSSSLQDELQGSEVLLFPWRAADENASDACAASADLQPGNR